MVKKLIVIVCVILVVAIGAIVIIPVCRSRREFSLNKEAAIAYVRRNYNFDFELRYEEQGSESWPDGVRVDRFVFYDKANDLCFELLLSDLGIQDLYSLAFDGKEVSHTVNRAFPPEEYQYEIRCIGEKYPDTKYPYEVMYCELVFFAEDREDLASAYQVLSFMQTAFVGLEVDLLIVPCAVKEQAKDILAYRSEKELCDLEHFHSRQFALENNLFLSVEDLYSLLNSAG